MEATVFVDVNPLASRKLTGIGRYTARLALSLKQQAGVAVRFAAHDQEILPPPALSWNHDQDLGRWARRLWRSRRASLSETGIPADSLAIYGCHRPAARRFPFEVSLLYDFTTLLVPWTHAEKARAQFARFFARDLLASDAVVAISEATRFDARWLCDVAPERVVVAYPGPSLCIEGHLDPEPVERRSNVGIVVSTLEPRKNPYFLLDWFAQTDVLPEAAELWWVGPVGWLTSSRRLRRYRHLRGRRVRFLGMVSDAALCRLYRTASWSVYPSLYEGFGLPVLDALRHGTPVLTAEHSSLRELDHPGVHYFDPYDPATLDDAWRALQAAGPTVVRRETLDARYNWNAAAQAVLNLRPRPTRAAEKAA